MNRAWTWGVISGISVLIMWLIGTYLWYPTPTWTNWLMGLLAGLGAWAGVYYGHREYERNQAMKQRARQRQHRHPPSDAQ